MCPKNHGINYHFSGLTSRHFQEWIPRPTAEQLIEINNMRSGTSYVDFDAANKMYGKATKDVLKLEDHGFFRYAFLYLLMLTH
jgi:hypothetical protein